MPDYWLDLTVLLIPVAMVIGGVLITSRMLKAHTRKPFKSKRKRK
jgi:hypothetical protein